MGTAEIARKTEVSWHYKEEPSDTLWGLKLQKEVELVECRVNQNVLVEIYRH